MKRVVIIGGGITGLAAAHRILELGQANKTTTRVTLLEAGSRLGGIVQSEEREGFLFEHGPDSFISEKPAALDLAKRIGLESRLIQTNPEHRRSFIVRNGELLPVPQGFHLLAPSRLWPFLTSPIFSWSGKARMAIELFLPRQQTNGSVDESLASFVRRRFGAEALERVAQAMVGGIYTADPEQLSLRATFPRFLDWEQKHGSVIRALRRNESSTEPHASGIYSRQAPDQPIDRDTSGARYSLFLSFDQGMQVLTDELSKRLTTTDVRLNCRVKYLRFENAKWVVASESESFEADAIGVTTPSYISAQLLRSFHAELAAALDEINYESSGTINLAFRRQQVGHPLDGFGFVVPVIERRSMIACTFSNVKFAGRAPTDHVLLRAFVGGALQRDILHLDESELVRRVVADLSELLRIKGAPLFTIVARWDRSMPQYHVGHLQRVATIRRISAEVPGLKLAGAAYSGVGIPDCIRSGESVAEEIASQLFGLRPD